jgi:hypothetical protein
MRRCATWTEADEQRTREVSGRLAHDWFGGPNEGQFSQGLRDDIYAAIKSAILADRAAGRGGGGKVFNTGDYVQWRGKAAEVMCYREAHYIVRDMAGKTHRWPEPGGDVAEVTSYEQSDRRARWRCATDFCFQIVNEDGEHCESCEAATEATAREVVGMVRATIEDLLVVAMDEERRAVQWALSTVLDRLAARWPGAADRPGDEGK